MANPIDRNALGKSGEDLAARWLLERREGSRILSRNFRCKQGEIDLIVWDAARSEVAFVEVRLRSERAWVDALESVTWKKRERIRRAAEVFLAKRGSLPPGARGLRLDILAIDTREGEARITYLENVGFGPSG
jgi:putative endonuclease